MNRKPSFLLTFGLLTALGVPAAAVAHEPAEEQPLVIDTDLGLDDAATLALALQSPDARVAAVVACDGACGGRKCADFLARLLREFNRSDVTLYDPAGRRKAAQAPPFRPFVEKALGAALPPAGGNRAHPFVPEAYTVHGRRTAVLALGPLTNLAAALRARPPIKAGIARVIIPGRPEVERNWNLRYDREAFEVVRRSGLRLVFAAPGGRVATKPAGWRPGELKSGANTAVGEGFLRRLLAPEKVREHYVTRLGFHDELAFLAVVDPSMFKPGDREDVLVPARGAAVAARFTRLLAEGRQHKDRVVFTDDPLPPSTLRPDVRRRMGRIIARNGRTEWFAQLLMNELHEHLGAYSVIGVKMGLRAAELLNAPQHAMKVVSHVTPKPPVSCLNDGIIVATGCTPGRALFSQGEVDASGVKVSFSYNGRTITLAVKEKYRDQVRRKIRALLRVSSLADHAYWEGVRALGLDIWENWHRRDLFAVTASVGAEAPRRCL